MRPAEVVRHGTQSACVDRALVYLALARLFRRPDPEGLVALRTRELPELLEALGRLGVDDSTLSAARSLETRLEAAEVGELRRAYERTFEASGGLRCSPHETAHTADTPGHALRRTFELADVAGFYRAFGVEPTPGGERVDHVAVELEFMHLLAAKEAVGRLEEGEGEHLQVCREASRSFLRDHLARFTPRLARRLADEADDPVYALAGAVLEAFVAGDAARLDAVPAS